MTNPREMSWVVTSDQPELDPQITSDAAAAQASLTEKLAVLRSLDEPFPDAAVPMDADIWIAWASSTSDQPT